MCLRGASSTRQTCSLPSRPLRSTPTTEADTHLPAPHPANTKPRENTTSRAGGIRRRPVSSLESAMQRRMGTSERQTALMNRVAQQNTVRRPKNPRGISRTGSCQCQRCKTKKRRDRGSKNGRRLAATYEGRSGDWEKHEGEGRKQKETLALVRQGSISCFITTARKPYPGPRDMETSRPLVSVPHFQSVHLSPSPLLRPHHQQIYPQWC